jgi:multidrug efflux pump subunit AcrA (membrane-fusion protein)
LAGCEKEPDAELQTAAQLKESVKTVRAVSETVTPVLATFGTVVHLNKADVYPTTEGIIEALLAEEGDRVGRDQVLAQLNQDRLLISRDEVTAAIQSKRSLVSLSREKLAEGRRAVEAQILAIQKAEVELEQRRAEFENAQTVYQNKQKLFAVGGVSEGELDTIKTRYLAAQTALSQAESDLSIQMIGFRDQDILAGGYPVPSAPEERKRILVELNTRKLAAEIQVAESELGAALSEQRRIDLLIDETAIRSPIDGLVGARMMDLGERATPQALLFTILNIRQVYVQIDVSEGDLSDIRVGQRVKLLMEEDSRPREGRVKLVSPLIDPKTRTTRVRVLVDNSNRDLIPGQFVRVEIATGEPVERITVPEDSVLTDTGGQSLVFLVRDGVVFRREIRVAWVQQDRVVLDSGLQSGDRIALDPSFSYRDGMEVEVLE